MARGSSKSFLLTTLLVAAAGSEVRRVGITANGRVASSKASSGSFVELSARASGLSFWRALRKQLEAKKKELDTTVSRNEMTSNREALWKAVVEFDNRFNNMLPCHVNENVDYGLDATYRKLGVLSSRECSLMCTAGERSGGGTPCRSFTYISATKECKFFGSVQPVPALWRNSPGSTSGPPCSLEGMRREIQAAFEAEMNQAMASQRLLNQELGDVHNLLADERNRAEQLAARLQKEKERVTTLKDTIVRSEKKTIAPEAASSKAAAPSTEPLKAPAAKSVNHAPRRQIASATANGRHAESTTVASSTKSNDLKKIQKHVDRHKVQKVGVHGAGNMSSPQKAEPVQRVQEKARKPMPDEVAKTLPAATSPEDNAFASFVKSWRFSACGVIFVLAVAFKLNNFIKSYKKPDEKELPANDALVGLAGDVGPPREQ
jgi:hypothetical protein